MSKQGHTNIACPRCGYDQRGVVAQWHDVCPLQTKCTECGLEIQWAEMLNPNLQRPRWCVEYATTRLDFLRRALLTVLIVFWPWTLWKSLRMIDPPRWKRLAGVPLSVVFLASATFFVVSQINGALSFRESILVNFTTNVSPFDVGWRAVFIPFSRKSPGIMNPIVTGRWANLTRPSQFPNVTSPYPSPWVCTTNAYGGIRLSWRAASATISIGCVALLMLSFCPVAFVALPVSRLRAKVRWEHLWRVMLYSLWWMIPPVLLFMIGHLFLGWDYRSGNRLLFWSTIISAYVILLAAIFFWQAAVRRYLRMSQSVGVAIAVVVMSWLAANAVVFYCLNPMSPGEMIEMATSVFR